MAREKAGQGEKGGAEEKDQAGQGRPDQPEPEREEDAEVSPDGWEDPPTYPHAPGYNPDYWPRLDH